MVKTKYADAYVEVLAIINNLVEEDYKKIPVEYIEFLESNCNKDYKFNYDNSKSFNEQDLIDETKYVLFFLFEKFGATERQKEQLKAFKINYYNKLEENKREKYNQSYNIVKKQDVIEQDVVSNNSLLVVEGNKNIINKIIIKIKKFLHIGFY